MKIKYIWRIGGDYILGLIEAESAAAALERAKEIMGAERYSNYRVLKLENLGSMHKEFSKLMA